MTNKEIVLNEIYKAHLFLKKYMNVAVRGDKRFDKIIETDIFNFGIEKVNLIAFKRLTIDEYWLLIICDDGVVLNVRNLSVANRLKNVNSWRFSEIKGAFYLRTREAVVLELIEKGKFIDLNVLISKRDSDEKLYRIIAQIIRDVSNAINNGVSTSIDRSVSTPINKRASTPKDRIESIQMNTNSYKDLKAKGVEGANLLYILEDLVDNKEYVKAIELADKILDNEENEDVHIYSMYLFKTKALIELQKYLQAQKYIGILFSMFDKLFGELKGMDFRDEIIYIDYLELKKMSANINYELENYDKALWEINDAYFTARGEELKLEFKEKREIALDSFMRNITKLGEYQRKIIYVDNELPNFKPDSIIPIRIDKLGNLKFPPSHPVKGELYVAHPFQSSTYYPMENHEQILFESQFVELNHLLQCLGATEIRSEHLRGSMMMEDTESMKVNSADTNRSVKGDVGNRWFSVNAKYDDKSSSSNRRERNYSDKNSSGKRLMSVQQFSPKISPFIPEDLIWYGHNETWQKLAQQRMQGGLNYYEMIISTNSVRVINDREKSNIKSDYKQLISTGFNRGKLNLSGSWEYDKHGESENEFLSSLDKQETNEWRLIVTFAPVEELSDKTISLGTHIHNAPILEATDYSENELKYIEDIKFAIEDDGIIDDDERRMLERNQSRYDISDERAKELEVQVLSKNEHSDEELEFIEEVNFILDHDGDIDDGDRRILLRLASRLGIAEQRAKELEEGVLMSREASSEFTEQEQQYIEELKFCLEEGPEISRSARRLLDRVAESLDINEERSKEIERVIIEQLKEVE